MFNPPIYLCSEVLRHLSFAEQCAAAKAMGYDGLEIAPFTLSEDPFTLTSAQLRGFREIAASEGIVISGLHWLMAAPEGLSITSLDPQVWQRSRDFGHKLIEICAELGGAYLVHGSPAQRQLDPEDPAQSQRQAEAYFAQMVPQAEAARCRYILEPLSAKMTGCFTSIAQTARFVEAVGSDHFGTMLDCFATANDGGDVAEVLTRWLPTGMVGHVHLNDENSGGPGQGRLDFTAILSALRSGGYAGAVGIEPFVYEPDPMRCASLSISHVRACLARVNAS